ncbi:hypothetical protein BCR33DRAFT_765877 [Rhizoclosmatium globosum]|uniref:DH domain-containing protein n=1 Tax=Rhizoclosmatium globosum TaxID=329046 RepID=A0A1Y2CD77_9FUNG|nr:hypothetical protein BCR33DRAFT_765877 [Rhizoclosmatium globosum]|eukprot:ORY44857.1 hypothetical protein BCR33DRAFT_765877 [Rhizoclosmatium globosum]
MNLATLPTDFLPHFNLTRLHLAGNNLLELPDGTLALLPALQFLDVSDNRISSLRKSLGSCKGLKEVYARNCGLVVVEEGVLEGLDNLEVLDLSVNQLSSFSNFAFANNTAHLHTLILSNNKLRTLPPSLGLHRGRELVFLLIGGNNFEQSLKIFTDPIITASQATVSRVTKDISARLTVVPDSDLSGAQFSSMGLSSGVSFLDRSERGSLYEWGDDDDDLRSVHDAEFDGGYRKPSEFRDKLRRRSSLPDMFRADNRRSGTAASISAARRSGEYGSAINHPGWGEALEANSATSYHASTNPSYVYIQRLLSHLHDVFDLSPQFHPLKVSVQRIGSMVETSRNGSTHEEFSGTVPVTGLGDDPDAEHLTEEERDRIRKRQSPVRRANIAAEILSTERTYVNELKTLVSLYADPLERGILIASDMGAMFSNLKSILYFHKSHMLPNIERAIQDPDQPLGSVFNEAAPFFKMYSMYFNNFDTANEMVIHLEQLAASGSGQLQSPIRSTVLASTSISPTNSTQTSRRTLAKKFKNLVKIAKSSSSHSQISLQSYLILPVQRLPRYKLLVDQLLESTPLNHPDRASLASAAEAIRNCVAECNDKKREMEEYERGMKQMTRIRTVKNKSTGALSKFSTVKIGRQFIQEATLRLVKYVERQHLSNTEGIGADMAFAMTSNRDKFFRSVVGAVVETRFAMGSSGPISNIPPPVAVTGQPHLGAGLDAVSVYGLQRTVGADFRFLLFTDVLCWCKPISGSMSSSPLAGGGSGISEAEFELIRAIDIGPHTKVEVMVVLSNPEPVGPTRLADRPNSMSIDHLRAYAAVNGSDPASQRLSGGMLTLTNTRGSTATNTPVIREPDSVLRISDNDSVLYLRAGQSEVESWLETLKGLGCVQDE